MACLFLTWRPSSYKAGITQAVGGSWSINLKNYWAVCSALRHNLHRERENENSAFSRYSAFISIQSAKENKRKSSLIQKNRGRGPKILKWRSNEFLSSNNDLLFLSHIFFHPFFSPHFIPSVHTEAFYKKNSETGLNILQLITGHFHSQKPMSP
jgi:hypothetical protein